MMIIIIVPPIFSNIKSSHYPRIFAIFLGEVPHVSLVSKASERAWRSTGAAWGDEDMESNIKKCGYSYSIVSIVIGSFEVSSMGFNGELMGNSSDFIGVQWKLSCGFNGIHGFNGNFMQIWI